MSVNVEFCIKNNSNKQDNQKIDFVPVFFDYEGEAKVEDLFRCKTTIDENTGMKKNYLFGRNLLGKAFEGKDKCKLISGSY
jgi:hypothetical protein